MAAKKIEKKHVCKTIDLEDGRQITMESGKLAKQADGAAVIQMGNTMILATVVSAEEAKEGVDFLPLTVNYKEQYAAAGRFPGGFFKREGRQSNYEVIISRLVDRAMRPLFPEDYHAETQILISLISADKNVMPDCLAGLAASAAVAASDIPFNGPISEVRVGKINGEFVINPNIDQLENAELDIIVAGTEDDINMVEGELNEVSEKEMVEALKFAHQAIQKQCAAQKEFEKEVGNIEKREYQHEEPADEEVKKEVKDYFTDKIKAIAQNPTSKDERSKAFKELVDNYIESLSDEEKAEKSDLIKDYFEDLKKEVVRDVVLKDGQRLDGRKTDEIRDIEIEVDYLASAHGSSIFTRGETQSLTSITLGSSLDQQMVDEVIFEKYEKFILHYNFPPFSTGESKPQRGPGRREVGHGHLAERSLKQVMPPNEENPYTVRVVSDILESNGSSSMATVCAGSLALMDAGIKIKQPVSGIAMGLIMNENRDYAILSDILGDEDHLGDMDFKVAGTEKGITACQMDLKVEGLSYELLEEALEQARKGRLHILEKMNETIAEPRDDYKPYAPRIEKIHVDKENIGALIGPGGKHIQELQEESGANISVDEENEQGVVEIMSDDKESLDKAKDRIEKMIETPEEGKVYNGVVKSIMPFGAFVEFLPGTDGLVHISEIAWERTESMDGIFEEGQEVQVKLKEIDKKTGKYALTMKELLPKPDGFQEPSKSSKKNKPPHKEKPKRE